MLRTEEEILQRARQTAKESCFGFGISDLCVYLPWSLAREFYNPKAEVEWEQRELTREAVIEQMLEYLDFAFDKALDHRGLSASRSIEHMRSWLWLLGDNELLEFADRSSSYPNYGVPILKRIAIKYDKTMPKGILDWADGEGCRPGCDEGCGH